MAKRRKKKSKPELAPATGLGALGAQLDYRRFAIFASVGLFLFTWLLYVNSLKGEFTNWDDTILVVNNPDIKSLSGSDIKRIFTPVPGKTYQPVRVFSYALDYSLWELNPLGFHLVNTFFHGLAGILLFFFLAEILSRMRPDAELDNRVIALAAAILWICHPINVESVSWIASRKYVLLATFSFGSLYCYVRSSQNGKLVPGWSAGATICFILAIMSSPFGVILPPIFMLIDYCREKDLNPICGLRKHYLALVPIAIAAVVMYAMIYKGLFGGGEGPGLRQAHVEGKVHWTIMTMMRVIFDYVMNFTAPLWLNCKYPNKMEQTLLNPKIILGMLGVIAVCWAVVWQLMKGNKLPFLCAVWMLIGWGPVSNIVPISTTMADRYMYLPSVGLFLAAALGLNALIDRGKLPAKAGLAIFATVALIYSGFTIHRNFAWRTSLDLWTNSIARHPDNPVAQNNMGNALRDRGNDIIAEAKQLQDAAMEAEGQAMVDSAQAHFERSLEIYEPHAEAHQSLGSHHLKKAVGNDPKNEHFVLAEKHLRRALELNPNYSEALNNLAILYARTRVFDKAIEMFERSTKLNDQRPGVWRNLAKASAQAATHQKKMIEANAPAEQRLAQTPAVYFKNAADAYMIGCALDNDVSGFIEAGVIYGSQLQDHESAVGAFQAALKIAPNNPKALRNLGVSLANLKRLQEAKQAFEKALAITPDDAGTRRFLETIKKRISEQ